MGIHWNCSQTGYFWVIKHVSIGREKYVFTYIMCQQ